VPDYNYKHVVVVHGIGNQAPNETALGFMNEFIRALPLADGRELRVHNLIESVDGLLQAKPGQLKKFQPAYVTYSDGKSVSVIGFSEVYWQPITNSYIEENGGHLPIPIFTWAHSVATRLLSADQGRSVYALAGWRAAIDNLEIMLQLLGALAGLAGKKEPFDAVTVKFLGDVQMYAESDEIRQKVNGKFFSVLARLDGFADQTRKSILARRGDPLLEQFAAFDDFSHREIYVVAHSEGTVVAYNSLVQAQMIANGSGGYPDDEFVRASKEHAKLPPDSDYAWLGKVRGLVTLGSPLDKHYFIWNSRFRKHQLQRDPEQRIPWLNFYDYNDPVAYSLEELRTPDRGQKKTDADRMFDLDKAGGDFGFERYPVPGVAHVRYWTDRSVYNQIVHLMGLSATQPEFPGSIGWVRAARLAPIWIGYPLLRAATFAVGLFFLNRLLHFGGYIRSEPFAFLYQRLAAQPFGLGNQFNYAFWLAAPVLLMKALAEAEQGRFFEFEVTHWIRWILSGAWLAMAAVICISLKTDGAGDGVLDLIGYVSGIAGSVLIWKLHTAVHRGLIQLWRYTAAA
jgi:hypothetical protein